MQPKFIPAAYIVSIQITRGDGTIFVIHQKILFNEREVDACKKQWPEQLKCYFDWAEDKYPGYKTEVVSTPLYRLNRVLEPIAEMLEDSDYYPGWGQYDNEAVAQQTSKDAAEAVRKLKTEELKWR